ncbi:2-keto-3-deoxy-L-rhamnonate aldolase RhmA [Mesorhizobium soli]|uniref:HpcH/HpaI aldolase family protein n=1 Tax=Pseudaminobacter soli (ex Li et al. 2025) TaxID=1295366 RepID=UPI002472F790|nr:aldolase/citrate lyase family protein [Mesorhizobium soli]MDH6233953.1 2-keto-3-deoxy-L-rhamnonate aldolase RhmA [Mesorhizobium soli]
MSELLSGRLKTRLIAGETIGLIWLSLGHAPIAEIAAHSGADAVVIDLQHGLWDRSTFEMAVGVSARTVPVLARVAENSALAIGSALDTGIDGVLVPMVETAEQAAAAVAAGRFPPHGHRSGGGVRPLSMGFDTYLQKAGSIAIGIMIETTKGVDNAEAIAATPGLDFILIGSGDLSISCAAIQGAARDVNEACRSVKAACQQVGIACGIFTPSSKKAAERRDEGYQLVVLANDLSAIKDVFADATKSFQEVS